MSVFKKLKGTFQSAQQDIVEGLRSLTTSDNPTRYDQHHSLKVREINLDAGADLLNSYQKSWSTIQTETRESANKAEEASTLLAPLFQIWENHAKSVSHLEEEVKTIPSINTMLAQLHSLLDGLSQSFITAEKELDILEDLCDEQEFQTRCLEEQKKLAMYKVMKDAEVERIKVELAQLHAKKMVESEAIKKKSLQERAEAFTSAFQNDLDFYRTHGYPGRIPTEFPKVTSLSDIELDQDDKQALDSFLGPGGDTEGTLELSGEGVYIEDDYTANFSVKQDMDFQEESSYSSAAVISQLDENEFTSSQSTHTLCVSNHSGDQKCQENSTETSNSKADDLNLLGDLETFQSDLEREHHKENQETTKYVTTSQNTDQDVT